MRSMIQIKITDLLTLLNVKRLRYNHLLVSCYQYEKLFINLSHGIRNK